MAPDAGISAQTKLSAEQVQTISEKLDDLLGQDGTAAARIEKGEVRLPLTTELH